MSIENCRTFIHFDTKYRYKIYRETKQNIVFTQFLNVENFSFLKVYFSYERAKQRNKNSFVFYMSLASYVRVLANSNKNKV